MTDRSQLTGLLLWVAARGLGGCNRPSSTARALLPTARAAHLQRAGSVAPPLARAEGWLPVAPHDPPASAPVAIVDLASPEALSQVRGEWRYSDVSLLRVVGKDVGKDLKPSGRVNQTDDLAPKAQAQDFDDSKWPVIDPRSLE